MKIALIRQRYNPFGGAERFVVRALEALRQQGAEVTLITRSWQGAPEEGFKQIVCDPPYRRWWGGRTARDQSFADAVQAILAAQSFDVVQAHERIPGCTLFRAGDGVHAAWLAHRRRVLGYGGRLAQSLSPFHRAVLAAEKAMFAHPALRAVICNSRMVADELRQFYDLPPERLHVMYNGVDGAVFHPGLAQAFRERVRAEHHIPDSACLFLFVGSGFQRKGVPALLQAFAQLSRPETRLVIVGADRKLKAMQRLADTLGIAGRVLFTGPVQDVRPWYGAADAFVLPTLYDPCPNAALEALSSGLPCLLSSSCGAAELLTPGKNGEICDALDIPAMTAGLAQLADWAGNAEKRFAARAAVADLSLPAMAEKLLVLYARLSGKAREAAPV